MIIEWSQGDCLNLRMNKVDSSCAYCGVKFLKKYSVGDPLADDGFKGV